MTEHTVTHATFTLEREYPVSPERVFAAWSDPKAKERWFANTEGWITDRYELDFQVGGREVFRGRPEEGPAVSFDGEYHDIVPNERIVNAYQMHVDGNRISVSLATVLFERSSEGTRLTYVEQGAFLDGFDNVEQREQGTADLLDVLGAHLAKETAST